MTIQLDHVIVSSHSQIASAKLNNARAVLTSWRGVRQEPTSTGWPWAMRHTPCAFQGMPFYFFEFNTKRIDFSSTLNIRGPRRRLRLAPN
jgi:hypothetical protein